MCQLFLVPGWGRSGSTVLGLREGQVNSPDMEVAQQFLVGGGAGRSTAFGPEDSQQFLMNSSLFWGRVGQQFLVWEGGAGQQLLVQETGQQSIVQVRDRLTVLGPGEGLDQQFLVRRRDRSTVLDLEVGCLTVLG